MAPARRSRRERVQAGAGLAPYVVAATTGKRRGEALGLRWQDLDLEAGRASISQTLVVVGGYEAQFSEPKTARGRRMVALDPHAGLALPPSKGG